MPTYYLPKRYLKRKNITANNTVAKSNITIETNNNDVISVDIDSSSVTRMSRVVATTTPWIADDNGSTVFYNKPAGGAETYTLPASPANNSIVTLVSYDVGGGVWSIDGNGKTINNQGIITMAVNKQSMTIEFNSTLDEWVILSVA